MHARSRRARFPRVKSRRCFAFSIVSFVTSGHSTSSRHFRSISHHVKRLLSLDLSAIAVSQIARRASRFTLSTSPIAGIFLLKYWP